ncbi:Hypothetical predicted protein, partial [Marmota monax]
TYWERCISWEIQKGRDRRDCLETEPMTRNMGFKGDIGETKIWVPLHMSETQGRSLECNLPSRTSKYGVLKVP